MAQKYDAEGVKYLATHFPRRNDSSYAWGNAISGLLCTARLRGLYGVSQDNAGVLYDHSGQARHLTPSANIPNVALVGITPSIEFTAASSMHYTRVDEAGLEPGSYLTAWAWIKFHTECTTNAIWFWSKHLTTGNQRSWALWKDAGDIIRFRVSGNGTASCEVNDAAANYVINKWLFIAGVFEASTREELYIGVGETGAWYSYKVPDAAVPASIYNGTAELRAGAAATDVSYLDGLMSLFGWAAYSVQEVAVWNIFHQTRPLFST